MVNRSSTVHRLAAALTAVAVITVSACGGDDNGEDEPSDGFSVEHALAELPESALDDDYVVTVGDFDAASAAAGVERPGPRASADDIIAWSFPVSGVTRDGDDPTPVALLFPDAVNPNALVRVDEFRDELGWAVNDVSWFAEVASPPMRFTVLHGDIDPAAIDDALGPREDDVWSVGGEDFEDDLQVRSAARPYGEALRLAQVGEAVAVSKSTPPIQGWLAGDEDRLDADADLLAVARALDEHDVYAAMLVDGGSLDFGPVIDTTDLGLGEPANELLETFDTLGAGLTVVDGDAVAVIVYHHSTAAKAQHNAELLEAIFADAPSVTTGRPLADTFDLLDVSVDGQIVTATVGFTGGFPRHLWDAVWSRSYFTAHR